MTAQQTGLKLVFMGSPEFSCPTLSALIDSPHQICHVLTQPPRASGRGMKETKTAVAQLAQAHDIPVSWPTSVSSQTEHDLLASLSADLFVVVAYGLILPKHILNLPALGCVNGHASLLPRWRGAAPIQRAIEAGDAHTGTCAMMMEEGLDTGPVIGRMTTAITPQDTAKSLHDRLADMTASCLMDAIDKLSSGTVIAEAQPQEGICYAAKIKKSEAALRLDEEAEIVRRHIHAFSPFPGAFLVGASGTRLKCLTAELAPHRHASKSGTYLGLSDTGGLMIACGAGTTLCVTTLQPAGKKPMPAADFLRGRPLRIGSSIEAQL